MIVIEKGAKKERWEINRDANTKVTGDVKVGEKVTVYVHDDRDGSGSESRQGR